MAAGEVRVRLHAPLRGATLADPAAALPPLPVVVVAPPPPEPPPPPPEPVVVAAEPVVSMEEELARRLDADRGLIEKSLAAMNQQIHALHETRSQERREWRKAAVELAVTLATRLVHDQILAGDFPLETVARELIGQVDAGPVTVYLHPDDLALINHRLDGKPLVERDEAVVIRPDPALPRGDCRVETGEAIALAQLDVQLADLRRRLLRSLGHAEP